MHVAFSLGLGQERPCRLSEFDQCASERAFSFAYNSDGGLIVVFEAEQQGFPQLKTWEARRSYGVVRRSDVRFWCRLTEATLVFADGGKRKQCMGRSDRCR